MRRTLPEPSNGWARKTAGTTVGGATMQGPFLPYLRQTNRQDLGSARDRGRAAERGDEVGTRLCGAAQSTHDHPRHSELPKARA